MQTNKKDSKKQVKALAPLLITIFAMMILIIAFIITTTVGFVRVSALESGLSLVSVETPGYNYSNES